MESMYCPACGCKHAFEIPPYSATWSEGKHHICGSCRRIFVVFGVFGELEIEEPPVARTADDAGGEEL